MRRAIAPLAALLLLAACGGGSTLETADLEILTVDGTVTLEVEVADEDDERRRGLMDRESLEPFDGMAFVWDEEIRSSFWMKDTLLPLSIAFWDERGSIVSILDMEPCRADPCRLYDPGVAFIGALEVDQGFFEEHQVDVGDQITIREPA